jgi:hypothetical protein
MRLASLGASLGCVLPSLLCGANLTISPLDRTGGFSWTGAFTGGVCTVECVTALTNRPTNEWRVQQSYFTTNSTGQGLLPVNATNRFFRLLAVDISPNTPLGYTNLLHSYGNLHTIAGNGAGGTDGVNYWQAGFEGGYATNAALSRPHIAMADDAGNVFIVDKGSHSVLKVTPDGRIHTVAGTHAPGFNGDGPAPATSLNLNQPNGLYVHGNGTFFILDTGNGRVRRVDTNGIMTLLFAVPGGIGIGRGLWVDEEELEVGVCDGTTVKYWTPANGLITLNTNFIDLGNLIPSGKEKNLWVTDRGDDKVYKVDISGSTIGQRTLVYGQGHGKPVVEGTSAVTNCLNGVRGIWRLPTDGYLLALHEGNQVLYVDPADTVHVFVAGQVGAHSGDGQWFYSPGFKLGQVRSVTMDAIGNIFIVEGDFGYVRKIDFQRLTP